jgi:coenzyme F420 hydrogenase subunit beta
MRHHTVFEIIENDLCTGCATCAGLCPENALSIKIDNRKGIYVPKLEKQKCNNCGLCEKVCPGYKPFFVESAFKDSNVPIQKTLVGDYKTCYIGHSVSSDIVENSSSGGLVTQLLVYLLESGKVDGVLVTKMNKESPLEPEPFIAQTRKEIISATKSKYCPNPLNVKLREILRSPGKYAMVGLPCQIQGTRKAEQQSKVLRDRLIYHFGLVCNHAPTFLATDHLLKQLGIPKQQVKRIEYRSKGRPSEMVITLKNGEVKRVNHNSTLFWGGCFSDFFYSHRCTTCDDKMCEFSDISFMDVWLPELSQCTGRESIAISRTNIGEEVLQSALSENLIEIEEIPVEKIIKGESLVSSRKKISARVRILQKMHRKTPVNNKPLSEASLNDYLRALSWPFRFYISEHPKLWLIIDLYNRLFKLSK